MLLKSFVLVTLSALLFALALPNELYNWGNPLLGYIALIPFFYTLYTSEKLSGTLVKSAYFGLLSTSLIYFWLLYFQDFSLWTLSGVVFVHIIFFILLGPILAAAGKYPRYIRPFITAGIWVIYEYLKSIGYLALPWGLMAHTSGTFLPIIQISDITGQWGVSFLIVLVNTVLLEFLMVQPIPFKLPRFLIRISLFTSLLIFSSLLYGIFSLHTKIPVIGKINAILVQQNADSWISGNEMESIRTGQILTRNTLKKAEKKPDIIIWSENAFRYPYTEGSLRYRHDPVNDPFDRFLKEVNIPILVGSPYILNPKTYAALNAVMLIAPGGKILQYYGKTHPVPFAENIPFWHVPFIRSFFKNVLGITSEGWTAGTPNIIFTVKDKNGKNIRFGAPICFEDSFPDIAINFFKAGADLLINLSNDSWSKTISGETQHYIAAKFRAVENRRTLIRSTNAGVTAVIDPYGKAHNLLPLFTSMAENVTIPVYKKPFLTFYTRFGDWFPVMLLILLISGHICFLRRKHSVHSFTNEQVHYSHFVWE